MNVHYNFSIKFFHTHYGGYKVKDQPTRPRPGEWGEHNSQGTTSWCQYPADNRSQSWPEVEWGWVNWWLAWTTTLCYQQDGSCYEGATRWRNPLLTKSPVTNIISFLWTGQKWIDIVCLYREWDVLVNGSIVMECMHYCNCEWNTKRLLWKCLLLFLCARLAVSSYRGKGRGCLQQRFRHSRRSGSYLNTINFLIISKVEQ